MTKYLNVLFIISFLTIVNTTNLLACDFDGDGTEERVAYEVDSDGNWIWNLIDANGQSSTLQGLGTADTYPAPGDYYGAGVTRLGVVNKVTFFWRVLSPGATVDTVNFGIENVSYMPGRDWNGDGITDLGKFVNRCNSLKKRCLTDSSTGNFLVSQTDGSKAFTSLSQATTGLFGGGLTSLFPMDIDADGDDDICYTVHSRKRPKKFRIVCKDILARAIVSSFNVGKIFERPFGLLVKGQPIVVLWKQNKSKSTIAFSFLNRSTKTKTKYSVAATLDSELTQPLLGDWLGKGYWQIGLPKDNQMIVIDIGSLDAITAQSIAFPSGTPVDCHTGFYGPNESRVLNTRNACKVLRCRS